MQPVSLPSLADLTAAIEFRNTTRGRADMLVGGIPTWHGWVVVEAYLAGLAAGRQEKIS